LIVALAFSVAAITYGFFHNPFWPSKVHNIRASYEQRLRIALDGVQLRSEVGLVLIPGRTQSPLKDSVCTQ